MDWRVPFLLAPKEELSGDWHHSEPTSQAVRLVILVFCVSGICVAKGITFKDFSARRVVFIHVMCLGFPKAENAQFFSEFSYAFLHRHNSFFSVQSSLLRCQSVSAIITSRSYYLTVILQPSSQQSSFRLSGFQSSLQPCTYCCFVAIPEVSFLTLKNVHTHKTNVRIIMTTEAQVRPSTALPTEALLIVLIHSVVFPTPGRWLGKEVLLVLCSIWSLRWSICLVRTADAMRMQIIAIYCWSQ